MLGNIIKKLILISALLILFSSSVFANEPIGAAIIMAFPLVVMIISYGIALIFVILIEGFILKKFLATTTLYALGISCKANLVSTIIGVGIGIIATIPLFFIIGWLGFTFLLAKWLKYIIKKTGYFNEQEWVLYICCLVVGLVAILVSASIKNLNILQLFTRFSDIKTILLLLVLLVFGFIISFVSESYVVIHMLKDNQSKIIPVVFKMNIVSYFVLILFAVIRALIK